MVYEAASDAAGMGCKVKENGLRPGNPSDGNRLPDRNKTHASDQEVSKPFQSLNSLSPKRNILGRNQNITQKHLGADPRRATIRQQQLTNILVERLGNGDIALGWQVYGNISEEEREWLERRQFRGELANEDVIQARLGSASQRPGGAGPSRRRSESGEGGSAGQETIFAP
ncbi:hypothetical protein RJJ65_15875 [Rhizobium hidalgonense]|uniref:Uncharacterized protein n=1 Tax=Rhizobium hidalgonense TaxID=1538159 RepID=A0AAJ2GU74_9HYPH|nr:hypothetical protein [Rhizobium hidalgonense]MDR9774115.1 hypothetical protein [Rhizobium hidalgonense]MDR9820604.1 hypothetical protein [Rhizobium hidalgonense]